MSLPYSHMILALLVVDFLVVVDGCYKYPKGKRDPCSELRCGPGEDCVVSHTNGVLSANCVCPASCPNYGDAVESSRVCSSSGVDYDSLCKMKQHACTTKTNITAKYFGKCDPCQDFTCPTGTTCHLGSNRKPECRCSEQCPLNFDPVCATDGKTYSNDCVMKVSACKAERSLEVYQRGKCEEMETPCQTLDCSHGSFCVIRNDTFASCECISFCPQMMKPVCATNGMTFDNECELERYACEQKSRITVKHEGTCGVGVCASFNGCQAPKVCVLVDEQPTCACPECSSELREVCGSNGRTYANECKMRREACELDKKLFVKYNGICEGCSSMQCEFYSFCVADGRSSPECRCPNDCPHQKKHNKNSVVCGTDGVTYSTECHLRRSACQQKKFIVVAFKGKCDACVNVECRYGEECRSGVCVCSYNCPSNPTPAMRVCGENGVLYPSECHLQLAACQKGSPIAEMPPAHCHSSVATFGDSCQCNRIGSIGPVCEADGQCKCRAGVGGEKCDHCLPTFWGIHLIANGALSCQPCGCSAFGSSRPDCEQTTGRCECKPDAFGDKCDKCNHDMIMTPSGCVKKEEYKTPGECSALKCYHGAVCVESDGSGLPDCQCPTACDASHLGMAANMTVCGSDGVTYDNFCQLQQFACKHQIDLVVHDLGICDEEAELMEVQDRTERNKEETIKLGTFCTMPADCAELNAICRIRPGRRGICACPAGSDVMGGKCVESPKEVEIPLEVKLSGRNGFRVNITKLDSFFNFSMQINARVSNGVILYGQVGQLDDFIFRLDNRRFSVEIGEDSLHARDYVTLHTDHTVTFSWRNRVATLQTTSGRVSARINVEKKSIKQLWLGSDDDGTVRSIEATVSGLSINEKPVTQEMLVVDRQPVSTSHPFFQPLTFEGKSYATMKKVKLDVRSIASVEIRLQPTSSDGLVFLWTSTKNGKSHGDFLALFLVASQPHFFWNLGSGISYVKAAPLKSRTTSQVVFGRNLKNGTISVNGVVAAEQESAGKNMHLDVSGENVYIGGTPSSDIVPDKLRKLNGSFHGTIEWLTINEHVIDFREMEVHGEIKRELDCLTRCHEGDLCYVRMSQHLCRGSSSPTIHLDGKKELAYPAGGNKFITASNGSSFSLSFRSSHADGIIWWQSTEDQREDGDFLIVYLQKSQLRLAFNLGNDIKFKSVVLNKKVALKKWNSLSIIRLERKLSVTVNGLEAATVISTPGSTELNDNGLIYLGGRKHEKKEVPVNHLFHGCVRDLKIDGKSINLVHDTVSTQVPTLCG